MKEKLIDVSTWNGNIDWGKVYKSGVKYAMIRSSFGVESPNQVDNKFTRNITNAVKAGVKCGVYHYSYAQSVEAAKQEAEFCLKTIKGYNITLPVAFDIEDSSQTHLGKDALTNIVIAFCDKIKSAGYTPMVYCNPNWLNNYLHKDKLIGKYDIWLAQWGVSSPSYNCAIWQYSENGGVSGISGSVDMNYIYKSYTKSATNVTNTTQKAASSTSAGTKTSTAKVIGKTSYIRSQALVDDEGGSSKKLKTVKVGTVLEWLSDDNYGWSKVKYSNTTGYIQNSRIDKKNISTWRIGTVTGNEVRLRKKPIDGAVTDYANKGDKLTVICQIFSGKNAGWTLVRYKNEDRYISSQYISLGEKRIKG